MLRGVTLSSGACTSSNPDPSCEGARVQPSGETAKGIYPVAAVEMMAETCVLAESTITHPPLFNGKFFVSCL